MYWKVLLGLLMTVLLISAVNATERFVVRIENPDNEIIALAIEREFDIAAYKPAQFLDIVADRTLFDELSQMEYELNVTQTESQLRSNLREGLRIDGYRTYDEVLDEMNTYVDQYEDLVRLYNIGDSWGKIYYDDGNINYEPYQHDIWALKLTDQPDEDLDKPAVYYMGAHHAREPLSTEVTMTVLEHLLDNYGDDDEITYLVDNTEIWFLPIVNPDGHKVVLDELDVWWRKNIRDNNENGQFDTSNYYGNGIDGVDLNRNYGFEWGASASFSATTYSGPAPFSEPELQPIEDLLAERHFVAGISYHTYSELVLYPYGYASNILAPDHLALSSLAIEMAEATPKLNSTGHYTPQQSWELYPARGTTDDHAYGQHGIFAYTFELATEFIPPPAQVIQVCQDNIEAAMILLRRVHHSTLTGLVTDQEGDPLVAEIFIDGVDDVGEFRHPYLSNEDFGRYYRMLTPGTYDVSFSAYGYETQTSEDVVITEDENTVLDIQLQPSGETYTMYGYVIDGETGENIENASVHVQNVEIDVEYTDEDGYFQFDNMYAYQYELYTSAAGYATNTMNVDFSATSDPLLIELHTLPDGSFESGELEASWEFDGHLPWQIDTSQTYQGDYAARSGAITHDQSSAMYITYYTPVQDEISFYFRVFSEEDYDFLKFYINDTIVDMWSGYVNWEQASFEVEAGYNTFRWEYSKDEAVSNGSDCAWIDEISFPISGIPIEYDFIVEPESIDVEIVSGDSLTTEIEVYNLTPLDVGWTAELDDDYDWIHIEETGGTIPAQESITIAVNLLSEGLEAGSYAANLQITCGDEWEYELPIHMDVLQTSADEDVPLVTELTGNYPNPFNPNTSINFSLSNVGHVTLDVYNLRGQKVNTLVDETMQPGYHTVNWDGRDKNDRPVASGIYFYRMQTGEYTYIRKMMLIK